MAKHGFSRNNCQKTPKVARKTNLAMDPQRINKKSLDTKYSIKVSYDIF
jgi:hypothetical protein